MKDKISVIYVDDTEINIVKFEALAESFEELEVAGTFSDAETALEFCAAKKPDLALLDIEMPGKNGLWLGEKLKEMDIPFAYLTMHKEYAVDAFNTAALHYIVKPVSALSLRELINRYDKFYRDKQETIDQTNSLNPNSKPICAAPTRIYVNTLKKVLVLQLDEINYLEADSSYTNFYMTDGTHIVSGKSMKYYTDTVLANPAFTKIHRSYIINQSQLESINKKKTEMIFTFRNKAQISVASFRINDWMDKFM
ncbi:MAG: response regulator transcription factor [Bacteroidetes bacterium]|nr:response regulator transcription factor [Bacteroidota bacterium]